MSFTYIVLGSGRQGTAAAFDMANWGDAKKIILADQDDELAQRSAVRVNQLVGSHVAEARELDVNDLTALMNLLREGDAVLSAVPYYYNLKITAAAVQSGIHMVDLGGNTDIVRQQHEFHQQAVNAGVSIIPDCGQVPGMGTSLMVYSMGLLDEAVDVYMWDGGIPQDPRPPFHYWLTFNIAGLTNEYAEPAIFLRDWQITQVEPMTEMEIVNFPEPIGKLEAFVAGGGTSTMPWTYQGKLRTLQNLTLRYPGHFNQLRAYWDLGLWSMEPIHIGSQSIVPRDVFHALFEPKVSYSDGRDLVIVRVRAVGAKAGKPAEAVVELIDYYDPETDFTAMERATGWSAAAVLEMAVKERTLHGAAGLEIMVNAPEFIQELRLRGMNVSEKVSLLSE